MSWPVLAQLVHSLYSFVATSPAEPQRDRPACILPPELLLHIFELASRDEDIAKILCLTSPLARYVARPRLFETVVVRGSHHIPLILTWLVDGAEPEINAPPRATLVHNLWDHFGLVRGGVLVKIILSCSNIRNLALEKHSAVELLKLGYHNIPSDVPHAHALALSHDIRLSLPGELRHVWRAAMVHARVLSRELRALQLPGLQRVTHLTYLHPSCSIREDVHVELFPRLTHLAVPYDYFSEDTTSFKADLGEVLRTGETLQEVVVIVWSEMRHTSYMMDLQLSEEQLRTIGEMDQRVRVVDRSIVNMQAEWEEEANGGASLWTT